MGGRGGSSGMSKGYGSYRINASSMPKLSGSEKQVSWANQIRESAINTVNKNIERALNEEKRSGLNGLFRNKIKAFEEIGRQLEGGFKGKTSASWIIENRGQFSSSRILRIANEMAQRYRQEER